MIRVIVWIALIVVAVGSCDDGWPPAVFDAGEIAALSPGQSAIRCVGCGDEEIRAVAERLKHLDYLFVNSTSKLTDDGIARLAELTYLRQLVVLNASSLSDASLSVLANMSQMRQLSLHDGTAFSPNGVLALARNPSLEQLYLCNAPQVTDAVVQLLRDHLPKCDIRVDNPSCPGYFPES
jgi:hypothetical protein